MVETCWPSKTEERGELRELRRKVRMVEPMYTSAVFDRLGPFVGEDD